MMIKDMMPLDRAFHERSGSIYSAMKDRFKEKRSVKGRLLQVGRELPFKLHEFRDWMEEQLGGKADGIVQCPYYEFCRTFISAQDLRVDHLNPIARGGELGFTNLGICCRTCNTEKGELMAQEYVDLMTMIHNGLLSRDAITDIRKRLRGSLLTFRGKGQKKPAYSGRSASTSSMFDPEEAF